MYFFISLHIHLHIHKLDFFIYIFVFKKNFAETVTVSAKFCLQELLVIFPGIYKPINTPTQGGRAEQMTKQGSNKGTYQNL